YPAGVALEFLGPAVGRGCLRADLGGVPADCGQPGGHVRPPPAVPGRPRGVAFGVWGTVTGLGVAIGPLLGGVLTSGLSWRYIFFVNVPIGIAAVAITMTRVAESRAPQASRPDWPGFLIFTVALSSLVYGLIESNQRSFSDGLVLGCLAVAAALL